MKRRNFLGIAPALGLGTMLPTAEQLERQAYEHWRLEAEESLSSTCKERGRPFRLALVIGHNTKNRGAKSPWMPSGLRTEWDFNQHLFGIMKKDCHHHGMEIQSFHRQATRSYSAEIKRCYQKVSAWNPDAVIELHFNASGRDKKGTFCIATGTKGRQFASIVQPELVKAFDRSSEEDWGVMKPIRGRGAKSCNAISAPTFIVEPTFAGSNEAEAKLLHSRLKPYAQSMLDGAAKWALRSV